MMVQIGSSSSYSGGEIGIDVILSAGDNAMSCSVKIKYNMTRYTSKDHSGYRTRA